VLRLARTITDLASLERIGAAQVAEAVQYRRLDAAL
jgi:predicted ATPase with chaperone activity